MSGFDRFSWVVSDKSVEEVSSKSEKTNGDLAKIARLI